MQLERQLDKLKRYILSNGKTRRDRAEENLVSEVKAKEFDGRSDQAGERADYPNTKSTAIDKVNERLFELQRRKAVLKERLFSSLS